MSGLFGSSKVQQPDPELAEAQERQEKRLEAEDKAKRQKLAANRRARMVGGQRMLLASREDAEQGIDSTLGRTKT